LAQYLKDPGSSPYIARMIRCHRVAFGGCVWRSWRAGEVDDDDVVEDGCCCWGCQLDSRIGLARKLREPLERLLDDRVGQARVSTGLAVVFEGQVVVLTQPQACGLRGPGSCEFDM
jgi:hypothetical protein